MELNIKNQGHRKHHVISTIFTDENDISFYLLGAYMTDGCISNIHRKVLFKITSKDKIWIENIRDLIVPNKKIYEHKSCICYELIVRDINSIRWLMSYGCLPNKSKTLELLKDIPKLYQRDFIRGVIDGDGSISYCKYIKTKNDKEYHYVKTTAYICSASIKFIEQLKKLIPSNINCHIITLSKEKQSCLIKGRKVTATGNFYRLQFNDSNAKKLFEWAYYKENKINLKRKQILADNLITVLNLEK